jgi:translation initiation factor 2 gamma subunit (eIF-2gamma)
LAKIKEKIVENVILVENKCDTFTKDDDNESNDKILNLFKTNIGVQVHK